MGAQLGKVADSSTGFLQILGLWSQELPVEISRSSVLLACSCLKLLRRAIWLHSWVWISFLYSTLFPFYLGDPHNDANAVGTDAFRTLFVGRIVSNVSSSLSRYIRFKHGGRKLCKHTKLADWPLKMTLCVTWLKMIHLASFLKEDGCQCFIYWNHFGGSHNISKIKSPDKYAEKGKNYLLKWLFK